MFERASKKLGLDQAIFLSNTFTANKEDNMKAEEMTKLKPKEIELLLRKGMIGLLNEQNDSQEEKEYFNMDIDQVIQNARVANYSFTKGTY